MGLAERFLTNIGVGVGVVVALIEGAHMAGLPRQTKCLMGDQLGSRLLRQLAGIAEVVRVAVGDDDLIDPRDRDAGGGKAFFQDLPAGRSGKPRINDGHAGTADDGIGVDVGQTRKSDGELQPKDVGRHLDDFLGSLLPLLANRSIGGGRSHDAMSVRTARRSAPKGVEMVKWSGEPVVSSLLLLAAAIAVDSRALERIPMKLSVMLNYAGDIKGTADEVSALEKAGLDCVWVAEAYSFDAISMMGYLAAKTERVEIGSAIVNVYSRTATLMAMTFAGLDYVSNGRINCGLGASGPQVVEGFHGVAYEKPMLRIKEYMEVCRATWKREVINFQGTTVKIPLPAGEGTGLGKPLKLINHPQRADIPLWWASLKGKSVEATAEAADGWIPIFYIPEKADLVWGDALALGMKKRAPELGKLQILAGGAVTITEDADRITKVLDAGRPASAREPQPSSPRARPRRSRRPALDYRHAARTPSPAPGPRRHFAG